MLLMLRLLCYFHFGILVMPEYTPYDFLPKRGCKHLRYQLRARSM
jgi:hypothetical protein